VLVSESRLERFFARWEFEAEHVLCASDIDGLSLSELLALADDDARERWANLRLGYTQTAGDPALRTEIAKRYQTVRAEDVIVCGGGAAEAVFLVMNALLTPYSHVVVVWPAFEPLHNTARAIGAKITAVPLDPSTGWAVDPDAFQFALRRNTTAIVTNFPHNPTGALPDATTFTAVLDLARNRDIPVVSDEVYRHLEFDPARRLPAAADLDPRFASIGVLSKSYGLAGLRIGWIASRDAELRHRILRLKDYTSVCAAAPSEILALIALRAHDQVVAGCAALVAENLGHVEEFFERWPGLFEWTPPAAGPVGFPKLLADVPIDRFVADLVHSEGVLLLPGTTFGNRDNRFRIGLGRRNMAAGLARLDNFVSRDLASFR
jgi:aspartate/methionine/tyrosine aminotransferase